jgi:hypothetical protein
MNSLDDLQRTPRRRGLHDLPHVLPSLQCFKGNSSSSNQSTVIDERIGAADEAVVVRGSGNKVDRSVTYNVTDGGAVEAAAKLGADSQLTAQDALKAATQLGQGAFNLSSNLGGALLDGVAEARRKDQEILATVSAQQSALVSKSLENATQLAESAQTGGDAQRNKTFLYVSGGLVLAVVTVSALVLRKR